jgi:hypothetical protein
MKIKILTYNNNIIIQFNSILYYLCADNNKTIPVTGRGGL